MREGGSGGRERVRKECRHGRSKGKRGGRGAREERGRKGDREGGKLQGRYPEEDATLISIVYRIQRTSNLVTSGQAIPFPLQTLFT